MAYKCQNCGAPLDGIVCSFCGARNEVDLKKRYEVFKESERVCPNCEIFLDTITIDEKKELYIEQCKHCYGIFLDYGELEALMEREIVKNDKHEFVKVRQILDNPIVREKEIKYKKCPECKTMMSRLNYKQQSGVIIDRCAKCGYWLDSGELRQMMEWAKLSGIKDFAPTLEKDISFKSSSTIDRSMRLDGAKNRYDIVDIFLDGFFHFLYRA
jgi:Zn-finger nucleic acid-binding protein